MTRVSQLTGRASIATVLAFFLICAISAGAQAPHSHGVLVHLRGTNAAAFAARHDVTLTPLISAQGVFVATPNDHRSDDALMAEFQTSDPSSQAEANQLLALPGFPKMDQSTVSVLNQAFVPQLSQSTVSVLNQSTVSVLNQSTVSVLNGDDIDYFGTPVRASYVSQPALQQINVGAAFSRATGKGIIIADIDNGVDPTHPALEPVLYPGYNFFDNSGDWSCYSDQSTVSVLNQSTVSVLNQSTVSVLNQSTVSVLNQSTVSVLNQSTVSVLNQSTVSVLNGSMLASSDGVVNTLLNAYPEIGHGTAVAGLLHLVAPQAFIMPVKAFGPDGTASLASVVEAIYFAVDNGATIINMSFDAAAPSPALQRAIDYARSRGVILAGSVGNLGEQILTYPAAYAGVLGTASVDANNQRASFSNYGRVVQVAAPGTGLITTFLDNHWALVSGTSFSAPLVAAQAALIEQERWSAWGINASVELTANRAIPGNEDRALGWGLIDVTASLGRVHGHE